MQALAGAAASEDAIACIICLDCLEDDALFRAHACGYCDKRICSQCLPNLMEIDHEGEGDEENGDLRCPNCRRSLMEGELHKRRLAIAKRAPGLSERVVADLVTLEDLIVRLMQLCAAPQIGVAYYNAGHDVVAQAIARDPHYTAMLERVLGSARTARRFLRGVRQSPTDNANMKGACKAYVALLVKAAGLAFDHARRILEEVAEQGLHNANDAERYAAAWDHMPSSNPVGAPPSPHGRHRRLGAEKKAEKRKRNAEGGGVRSQSHRAI
jgi:DNA-directed RNA polymerase subunit RPC12/RpoP